MPFVTFTGRRGPRPADKSRLSEAMLEAQVAAGYHRADRFHRFLEVDRDDLLVDLRFPDYATDRTDRFMVVEVVISSGRPAGTAATPRGEGAEPFGAAQAPKVSPRAPPNLVNQSRLSRVWMNPRLCVGLIKIPFMQTRGGMLATK